VTIPLADARLTLAPLTNLDIGALAAAAISYIAYRVGALTGGGALAAFVVGTATYATLGRPGAAVLLAFFVTSVALSLLGRARKRRLQTIEKQGARDASQVLANGGVATICVLLALFGDPRFVAAFAGAFAAATADTWGTEVGTLSGRIPRSILTFRPVAAGLSGGVTLAGSAAELAGAGLIGWVAALTHLASAWPVLVGGIAGALLDSVLGASLQALRWCPQCRHACENEPHHCGANTTVIRGAAWITNDVVNALATLCGAAVAFALAGSFS
jgi:uncharacterized protein (TIGR00297 family)